MGSQPGPLGGRTHCQLGTHSRAQLRCVLEARDSTPGLAEGRLHVRGPRRKFLEPSCSAQEARPQMLFLRVRPEIQACLGLPPRGPFPNGLGRLPQTLPLSPHLPSLVLGPLHLVGLCEVVWAGGGVGRCSQPRCEPCSSLLPWLLGNPGDLISSLRCILLS